MTEGAAVLIDLHYLPSIEYFTLLKKAGKVILEKQENFQKQSFRNRCYILTANGPFSLTVPVKDGNRHRPVKEVEIDFKQKKWVLDHWRAIQSAYGKSPFFEHYAPMMEPYFKNVPELLWDWNRSLLTFCLKLLQWDIPIEESDVYNKNPDENGLLDMRSGIHPKKSYKKNGIIKPCEYAQVFGKKFVENLSIIDLLFNEGPNAGAVLENSYAGLGK